MAFLQGLNANGVQYVTAAPTVNGVNAGVANAPDTVRTNAGSVVVDGTPVRVAVLALAAAAGLTALKFSGFRFNVAVSNR